MMRVCVCAHRCVCVSVPSGKPLSWTLSLVYVQHFHLLSLNPDHITESSTEIVFITGLLQDYNGISDLTDQSAFIFCILLSGFICPSLLVTP